ncbi:MAG: putative glycosyltransferase [uncultured marine phage]|uniref:Putative glycosyltransferase n=1 Tax=uncultured marine phage TaxID=707152 RepID=A0A8D9C9I9_9VIRU|nr:MAG: putative glycosyltransferase [uncultured marine phage]
MKKICLFSSYSTKSTIDNYVKFYVEILKSHFDEVILITNERNVEKKEIDFLKRVNVKLKMVKNEGLDFGMYHKGIMEIDTTMYDQIAFVNDSCVLFNKRSLKILLEWVDKSDLDYCGITDSKQIKYHLQSYFTIVKKKAIPKLYDFYKSNGIFNGDSREIIEKYEIGLSQMFIDNGFKIGSYFKCKNYASPNISIMEAHNLINSDCPVIKKKLLLNSFRDHESDFLKAHNFNFKFNYRSVMNQKMRNTNVCLEYLMEL